jgi:mannose/cellobiose epimerase-like protein (N-acyl-D-glucosamine 2-epimerase family)
MNAPASQQPLIASPEHGEWLRSQAVDLLHFAHGCIVPGRGAGWVTNDGGLDLSRGVHTWITCRMAHSYSIGTLLGVPGAREIATDAIAALLGPLHDDAHGGWYASIPAVPDSPEGFDNTKAAYAHAFVVLAGTSGVRAGIEGADRLLELALEVVETRFFDAESGLHVDEWNADWTDLSEYRGVNANMHAVEALLAAGDVTGDAKYHERALGIARIVALEWAAQHSWRIPEHFDSDWTPLLEFNADRKDDQFKPYGATVGHGIEWARLLLHLDATFGTGTHPWLVDSARELYARAVTDGWRLSSHGVSGFVYTTDWSGEPVVETRMHWVAAEALASAAALFTATGDTIYAEDYERWLEHVQQYFMDSELGSWHHELDSANQPAAEVWPGKPDIYHALGALLVPLVPLSPSLTSAIAERESSIGE